LIGASVTDSVIILNTDLAVKAFAGHGQIKFGGNLSIAAGPVGREGDGSAYLGDGGVAACYSYSHSRGLFAGISLQGAIFMTRDSDNSKFYGYPVRSQEILKGAAVPPDFEDLKRLYEVLDIVNKSETDAFSFRDPKMQSFRDSSGVSFHANPGANYQSHKFDDEDDDDDASRGAPSTSMSWGNDEDDVAFSKAFQASTIATKTDDLAPGWVKVSTDGGDPYYWHEESGKTQWEVPVKTVARGPAPPPPPPAKADPDALPPGWTKVVTGDGQPYYWNESKNITQWEKPVAEAPVQNYGIQQPYQAQRQSLYQQQPAPQSQSFQKQQPAAQLQSFSSGNVQTKPVSLQRPGSSLNAGRSMPQFSSGQGMGNPTLKPTTSGSQASSKPPVPNRPGSIRSKPADNPFESM